MVHVGKLPQAIPSWFVFTCCNFLYLCLCWFKNMATNDLTYLPLRGSVSLSLELGWAHVAGGPKEYGRSDTTLLLRLGQERPCCFHLTCWEHSFLQPWAPVQEAWLLWGCQTGGATCRAIVCRPRGACPSHVPHMWVKNHLGSRLSGPALPAPAIGVTPAEVPDILEQRRTTFPVPKLLIQRAHEHNTMMVSVLHHCGFLNYG